MEANLTAMPLRGLKGCTIVVENLNDDAVRDGLNERNLHREVAAKLTSIGILVGTTPSLTSPFLNVRVLVSKLSKAAYVFTVLLELREIVAPERDKEALFLATTWRQSSTSTADRNALPARVGDTLSIIFEDFSKDYNLANAK